VRLAIPLPVWAKVSLTTREVVSATGGRVPGMTIALRRCSMTRHTVQATPLCRERSFRSTGGLQHAVPARSTKSPFDFAIRHITFNEAPRRSAMPGIRTLHFTSPRRLLIIGSSAVKADTFLVEGSSYRQGNLPAAQPSVRAVRPRLPGESTNGFRLGNRVLLASETSPASARLVPPESGEDLTDKNGADHGAILA
jgi:hypothetical protein